VYAARRGLLFRYTVDTGRWAPLVFGLSIEKQFCRPNLIFFRNRNHRSDSSMLALAFLRFSLVLSFRYRVTRIRKLISSTKHRICVFFITNHQPLFRYAPPYTCGISSLLRSDNLVLFTLLLVYLILRISPHHSHHLCSHHLPLPWPFTPDLKLISFTNPFLHSLSGSIRTAVADLGLGPDLVATGVCLF